ADAGGGAPRCGQVLRARAYDDQQHDSNGWNHAHCVQVLDLDVAIPRAAMRLLNLERSTDFEVFDDPIGHVTPRRSTASRLCESIRNADILPALPGKCLETKMATGCCPRKRKEAPGE